ncbi:MAG: hypothetical protein AB8B89_08360 [Gammaproteobacteria bacterium]
MNKLVTASKTLLLVLILQSQAHSAMVSYGFEKITNNNVEDLTNQLSITVWDATEANSEFMLMLNANQVLFTVGNDVGIASNIAEVYFDDGGSLLGPSSVLNSLAGVTNFSGGGANPGNLPSGNNVGFSATATLSADVNPGPPANGVNESIDILGITLGLGSFADFNAVVSAINSGDLRFGYHVRSIGTAGGSDSYVSTVVPIPAAIWLFGSAILGLISFNRRQSI